MKTKLITSLDELEPGMKTKDGWEIHEPEDSGFWWCHWYRGGDFVCRVYLDSDEAEAVFLGREVEVPE